MTARAILTPRANSHPFQERTATLEQPLKIGRSVARSRPASNNAIFDCKVLSRNHALLWFEGGKFFIQDTKSSNGTFVNDVRLSKSSEESRPHQISSGDILQFGVDVMEVTKKVTHGCIVATLQLFTPDGKEAKCSQILEKAPPALKDIYKLNQFLREASQRERKLELKLAEMKRIITNASDGVRSGWKILIEEDRLLTRIDILERQLQACHKSMTEDKLREEVIQLNSDKEKYQEAAKEALRKCLTDKMEIVTKCEELDRAISTKEQDHRLLSERFSQLTTELEELATRYEESERKYKELVIEMETKDKFEKDSLDSKNIQNGFPSPPLPSSDSSENIQNTNEDRLREEVIQLNADKEIYEEAANLALKRCRADKLEVTKKCDDLEKSLKENIESNGLLVDRNHQLVVEVKEFQLKFEECERKLKDLAAELEMKEKSIIEVPETKDLQNGLPLPILPPSESNEKIQSDIEIQLHDELTRLIAEKERLEKDAKETIRRHWEERVDVDIKYQGLEQKLIQKDDDYRLLLVRNQELTIELESLLVRYELCDLNYKKLMEEKEEISTSMLTSVTSEYDMSTSSLESVLASPPALTTFDTKDTAEFTALMVQMRVMEEELAAFKCRYDERTTECSRLSRRLDQSHARRVPFYMRWGFLIFICVNLFVSVLIAFLLR